MSDYTRAQKADAMLDFLGWTLREAGQRMGVTHMTVHRWRLQARIDSGEREDDGAGCQPGLMALRVLKREVDSA